MNHERGGSTHNYRLVTLADGGEGFEGEQSTFVVHTHGAQSSPSTERIEVSQKRVRENPDMQYNEDAPQRYYEVVKNGESRSPRHSGDYPTQPNSTRSSGAYSNEEYDNQRGSNIVYRTAMDDAARSSTAGAQKMRDLPNLRFEGSRISNEDVQSAIMATASQPRDSPSLARPVININSTLQSRKRPAPKNTTIINNSASGSQPMSPTASTLGDSLGSNNKNPRDDMRRKQHNEVERRRRDKINTWIAKLAKIIPECGDTEMKDVKSSSSKGAVLAKCYQHIMHLQRDNEELVKKIDATPVIPSDATVDERYAITINAMDEEISRLQHLLREVRQDRDDIIEAVRKQGVNLQFAGANDVIEPERRPVDEHQRQRDLEKAIGFSRHVEEENKRLSRLQREAEAQYGDSDEERVRTQLTTAGNGMVVITDVVDN